MRECVERLESFTMLLGKFALSHDFYMRIFKAVLLRCIKLPRTNEFSKLVRASTKRHHDRVAEMRQDRDNTKLTISSEVGPAHLWAWEAALEWLGSQLNLDKEANVA